MNILGIGRDVLVGMAEKARQSEAPELSQIHVHGFNLPQDEDVYRATLQVVAGNPNMIVWQNVDIRPEDVADTRGGLLLELIEIHFINGVLALRQRCIDMGLLQPPDSAVQSI